MQKALMLACVFLLSGAWLTAQSDSQTGSKDSGAASGQTTVQGCLQGSNGAYTLTSDSGTMYQLQGDSATLSKHSGHEVRITGSTSGAGDSSNAMSPNAGASGSSGQTLTVTHLKHVSKTCSNTNTNK
jgi:hypothetical protein